MAGFFLRIGEAEGPARLSRVYETVRVLPPRAWPWAVPSDDDVVWAEEQDRGKPVTQGLTAYSPEIFQDRQRVCQTELAEMARKNPSFTAPAVRRVTLGVKRYLAGLIERQVGFTSPKIASVIQDGAVVEAVADSTKKYLYCKAGYGRLGQTEDGEKLSQKELYDNCMNALARGGIPTILSIHDFMGRKLFKELGGLSEGQLGLYTSTGVRVRNVHYFGANEAEAEQRRGREERTPGIRPKASTAAGVLPEDSKIGKADQLRERGIDKWKMKEVNEPSFIKDIKERNIVFGAGPSGSTSTLLQAAITFGDLNQDDELLKQYVLAIVVYLVGGGMHTYHELMVIAKLAGYPYEPGAFAPSLPDSFKGSRQYKMWSETYYDVVVKGGLYWMWKPEAPSLRGLGPSVKERVAELEALSKATKGGLAGR